MSIVVGMIISSEERGTSWMDFSLALEPFRLRGGGGLGGGPSTEGCCCAVVVCFVSVLELPELLE